MIKYCSILLLPHKNQTIKAMKRFTTLLLISMIIFSLSAEERNIELQKHALTPERRSLMEVPTVSYENFTCYIHSNIPLNNLRVIITNLTSGITLYFKNITIGGGQTYILNINPKESGNYKIEIKYEQTSYYGFFDLHN